MPVKNVPYPLETLEKLWTKWSLHYKTRLIEVPSERIGELAMEKLKDIDEVAYVRFASVYRQFQDGTKPLWMNWKSMMKTK